VVGFDQYRAGRVLAQDRLRVGSVIEEESNQPSGTVMRTDPRAGVAVWPGSTVYLVIAKPPAMSQPPGSKEPPVTKKLPVPGKPE
jgi:beta-lactam-binding protein with PASTA domain